MQGPVHLTGPTAKDDAFGWTEILSLAIQVGTRAGFGDSIEVSVKQGKPESAGWQGWPDAWFLALSFKVPGGRDTLATYFFAPWQYLSGTKGASHCPVPLLTVTPNVMVFGPVAGPNFHQDTIPVVEKLSQAVSVAVNLEANNEVRWHRLEGSLPEVLQAEHVDIRSHYALVEGRLIGSQIPGERALSLLVPGKMIGLTVTQDSGHVTRLWVPPAPYEPPSPKAHDPMEQRLDDSAMSQLPALHAEMTRRVLGIYRRALEQALEETSESRRRLAFFRETEEVRGAIFDYPFHSGPAFAAGAGEFDLSCREFARLLALPPATAEEKLLPITSEEVLGLGLGLDFEHANLYLDVDGRSLVPGIARLPPPSLDNLPALLIAMAEYQRLAEQSPCKWGPGDVSVGENPKQYYPSDEELLVSIIGRSIQHIVGTTERDDVSRILEKAGVAATSVEYAVVRMRQVHVGGKGQLFHADPPEPTRVQLV